MDDFVASEVANCLQKTVGNSGRLIFTGGAKSAESAEKRASIPGVHDQNDGGILSEGPVKLHYVRVVETGENRQLR